MQRLMTQAGRRPEVPAEDLAKIKAAFRGEWEAFVRRRRAARFRRRTLALAAVLVATLGLAGWWWSIRPQAVHPPVARVVHLTGEAFLHLAQEAGGVRTARLAEGERIAAAPGAEIAVDGEGAVALELVEGPSLRIAPGSRLQLVSASVFHLARGAVYVDSGTGPHQAEAVAVRTPLGVVTDVGTRFEVRLLEADGGTLRVRVREGEVRIDGGGTAHSAGTGMEITLHADGEVSRSSVPAWGDPWQWVLRAAPRLDIEGRSLREFLGWVGHETGWEIRYADPEIAASADSILLHGSLGDLPPDQAPAVVLPGAGLRSELHGGALVIRPDR